MKLRGAHYLILAVVVGLVAVFAVNRTIALRTGAAAEPTKKVLVAMADLTAGTALSDRVVQVKDWPQRLAPPQAAASKGQVEGRVLAIPLFKDEPIILTKLAPEGTAAGLVGILGEEMRAFTVKVDDVSGVAGFIHPGDFVDVLMSLPMSDTKGELLSKIILQDVKVLTAGQYWQQNGNNDPKSVNTVTLEVNAEQSEILNLAATQGKIRLTLRSKNNKLVKPTEGVATSALTKNNGRLAKNEILPRQRKPIEVIKGLEKTATVL